MTKYYLMTACIIVLLGDVSRASVPGPTFEFGEVPQGAAVRRFLLRSQLPSHLKDVLEHALFHSSMFKATMDVNFPGQDSPIDYHLDAKTRRVVAHIDFATGEFTYFPGFFSLPEAEQVAMIVHLGLHRMQGLGLMRMSEPAIAGLMALVEKNVKAESVVERDKTRIEMKTYIDQIWSLTSNGQVSLTAPPLPALEPWPFKKTLEAKSAVGK